MSFPVFHRHYFYRLAISTPNSPSVHVDICTSELNYDLVGLGKTCLVILCRRKRPSHFRAPSFFVLLQRYEHGEHDLYFFYLQRVWKCRPDGGSRRLSRRTESDLSLASGLIFDRSSPFVPLSTFLSSFSVLSVLVRNFPNLPRLYLLTPFRTG